MAARKKAETAKTYKSKVAHLDFSKMNIDGIEDGTTHEGRLVQAPKDIQAANKGYWGKDTDYLNRVFVLASGKVEFDGSTGGKAPAGSPLRKLYEKGVYTIGTADLETGVVTLKTEWEFEGTPPDPTELPKRPPSPFQDTPESRQLVQEEAAAFKAVIEASIGMTKTRWEKAVTFMREGEKPTITLTFDITDPAQARTEFEAVVADYETLVEATKDFTVAQRTRALRHAAHFFSIRKGNTWLR